MSAPGFFLPHRHAERVRPPASYPALEPVFARAFARTMRPWLDRLAAHVPAYRGFAGPPPAPRFAQDWFTGLDAAFAYALVRAVAPRRIVEIGSGHSTRFLARAVADGGQATEIVCVDPAPRARLDGLAVTWRRDLLQETDPALFADLGAGDVLFVDSSHLLVPGSDVDLVLNGVLPALAPGVLVHFHDVFLPDGYPAAWAWRGYNEQAALGPLLGAETLLWSSRYVRTRAAAAIPPELDAAIRPNAVWETSLWRVWGGGEGKEFPFLSPG